MTSNNPAAVPPTRTYTRFSDASRDVLDARIFQGIHFRFADEAGRKNGLKVAKLAFKHALRPVGGGEDDGDDDGTTTDIASPARAGPSASPLPGSARLRRS